MLSFWISKRTGIGPSLKGRSEQCVGISQCLLLLAKRVYYSWLLLIFCVNGPVIRLTIFGYALSTWSRELLRFDLHDIEAAELKLSHVKKK